jgi:hypothetical protein
MGSHMYHGTLGQCAIPWDSVDVPWDPTCTMGHWDSVLYHGTVWTSHGVPHVPWDTGTVCYTMGQCGRPMGSHMYHGTLLYHGSTYVDIFWLSH